MPFNASGVLTRLYNWIADRDAGIKIRADPFNGPSTPLQTE